MGITPSCLRCMVYSLMPVRQTAMVGDSVQWDRKSSGVEQAILKVNQDVLATYGDVNRAAEQLSELEKLPRCRRSNGVSIGGNAAWARGGPQGPM